MTIEAPAESNPLDAYALLSKPTLDLSDAEVAIVVTDLRRRRQMFVQTGKPDKAKPAVKAAPGAKPTAAEKAQATAELLASLNLDI